MRTGIRSLILLSLFLAACSALPQIEDISTLPPGELCVIAESRGDSLAAAGYNAQAADYYIMGAAALDPGDSVRVRLTEKAVQVLDGPSVICGGLVLESGDSLAPYRALQIGGSGIAGRILTELENGSEYILPEYISLILADTLLSDGDPQSALRALSHVSGGLPARADDKRTILYFRAYLQNGELQKADSVISVAESGDDDELLSVLYHYRGMSKIDNNIQGYMDDILYSFDLWPAAPVHAAAFDAVKAELLLDRDNACRAADAFYAGGLWNEGYELALEISDPDPHVYYLGAQTRRRLGFYQSAIDMYEHYLENWLDEEDAPDVMINLGRIYGKIGEVGAGINVIEEYNRTFPQHHRIINTSWYIGYIYFQNDMFGEAIPYLSELVDNYPVSVLVDDCHFLLAFSLMKEGREGEAVSELHDFIGRRKSSSYHSSARYLLGKILLESDSDAGAEILTELNDEYPRTLPAYFARELLGMPDYVPSFASQPLADWMIAGGVEPAAPPQASLNGLFLVDAGLRELAMGEFFRGEDEVGNAGKLAVFYYNSEIWERRPASAWKLLNIGDSSTGLPVEIWEMRYQRAWPELVEPLCEEYDIPPNFIWGIVRNESMFRPWTYSVAGARGLIQMIPSTSEYVAVEQGWDDYSPDRLYAPEVSLEYGICYISGLDVLFGRNSVVTAASYNAGPHNALEWGAAGYAPDEFFMKIIYDETRGYTQRVHFAQRIYDYLYSD